MQDRERAYRSPFSARGSVTESDEKQALPSEPAGRVAAWRTILRDRGVVGNVVAGTVVTSVAVVGLVGVVMQSPSAVADLRSLLLFVAGAASTWLFRKKGGT